MYKRQDRYWLHTQPESARAETPFGGSIAHGLLLLSLTVADDVVQITGLPGVVRVLNYGLDKVRFLSPVRSDARVRVHSKVDSVVEKNPGHWLVRQIKTVEVEGQSGPALVAEQLALVSLCLLYTSIELRFQDIGAALQPGRHQRGERTIEDQ